ncbi:MAG TPA: isochorismatase family protein [Pseudolysinimonas sp.]
MPVTELDPVTALLVVDLQKGVIGLPVQPSPDTVVANAVRLIHAFRAHALPLVLINAAGGASGRTEFSAAMAAMPRPEGWDELVPELGAQAGDILITKRTWGAFTGTDLDKQLRAHNVTQVVVVGIATSAGVESTARQAHEHGYHVTLATDAMADRSPEVHGNSIGAIFPRLGETGTTDDVLALLEATHRA